MAALAEAGVDQLVAGVRYQTADEFRRHPDFLAERVGALPVLRNA